jgi:large subunit ribosomal protein L25
MVRKNLAVQERTEFKKSAAKQLRKKGKIPAIIYGSKENAAIIVDAHEFRKEFHTITANTIINLSGEGKNWEVLVKDFQEDLIKDTILHIDFYEIEEGKKLKTSAPIHIEGTAPGLMEGGILEQRLYSIEIECLPIDLPDSISIDVSELEVGDSIHVDELTTSEGVKILNIPEQVVVSIIIPKIVEVEEEVEEGLEEELGEEGEGEGEETSEESSEESAE